MAGLGLAGIALAGVAVSDRDRLAQFAGSLHGQFGLGSVISTADARPSVAVLPFDNLSGDEGQTYFTDGLTEDIIAELARNRELQVIARNSTFALRNTPTDIREVGRVLGAGYVVEGSARRSGDQLRVVAQLIDAASGAHVWSRSYDRQVADVFAVQTELTEEIVASLVSYVRESESASAAASDDPTESLPAYDLVLQGRDRYKHGSSDGQALLGARALFQRAIELDPNYAAAHAHLGMTYIVDRNENLTGEATASDLELGLASAREAVRLEPDLPLAYQILSYGLATSGDFEGSKHAGERAVELNPSDPDSLMALAKAQVRFGDYEDAVRNAERALRLHPIAPEYYAYVHGQSLYAAGRAAEADEVLAACLVRAPTEPNCLRMRVAVQVLEGDLEAARETLARLRTADPDFSIERERQMRRFGDSPLMASYLTELARAHEAPSAAVARSPSGA